MNCLDFVELDIIFMVDMYVNIAGVSRRTIHFASVNCSYFVCR